MRATPEFDFALGESATMIRDTVARFADEQIMPLAGRIDRRLPRHRPGDGDSRRRRWCLCGDG